MPIRFAADVRQDFAAALAAQVDAGSGAGKIRVYSGAQPANAATAVTGTLLLEFTLADPGFTASGGVATLDVDPALTDDALATGTPGYARVLDSADNAVFDGSVTGTGGGGDFLISDTTLETGQTVTLVSGTITWPAA